MANLLVKDGATVSKYLKTSGAGSDIDPHVPEHLESNSAAIKAAVEAMSTAVAGGGAVVTPTITVSTTPAYNAGDSVGGKITLTNAVRVSGGITLLQSIQITDRANQRPTGTILIYNADPAAATLTDNATVVNSTDDFKIVAEIPVAASDYVTVNNKAYATLRNLGAEVKVASGTTLYASFVLTSTPTFVATTDLQMMFGFIHVN